MRLLPLLSLAALVLAPRNLPIMSLQGAGPTSPYASDSVSTTGVVTMRARDGFYLQDPTGDGNDATSDAVFVRSPANVFLGDEVRLVGAVDETLPGNDPANLTVTEIVASGVTRLRAGRPLPAPVCIERDGRFPVTDGLFFWESLEGMRVCVRSPHVIQGTNSDGVWVVSDDMELSARGALAVLPGDIHPERIRLVAAGMPSFVPGDILTDVSGVVNYRNGNYELLLDSMPARVSGHLSREIATLSSDAEHIRVASFNLHNLSRDEPERMQEIARVIVSQLGAPEIIGLEEVVDDSGEENDGVVDATLTLRALVAAIREADGPVYDFREVLPADGADGGAPGNNIRVALLFDRARVEFVDRGDSFGAAETRVVSKNGHPELTRSPGRILPGNPAWVASRKPLACELRVENSTLFVVVCHFVSQSRSSPLFGAVQPPVDPDAEKRRCQAALVASFVGEALLIDPSVRVVVLGDLNDDWFSPAIAALEQAPLTDLWTQIPAQERYSLLYDGNAQAFDHVLVSPALVDDARFDVVRVAAEFPSGVSDHDPVIASVRVSERAQGVEMAGFTLSQAKPNPFSRSVTMDVYASALHADMHAAVFDVSGRKITAVAAVNNLTVSWGGHDDAGNLVPAGVYFIRVSDGVTTRARKVVLIRR